MQPEAEFLPLDADTLQKLWQESLSGDAHFDTLAIDSSFRPERLLDPELKDPPRGGARFVPCGLLGRGGMGEVYLARQSRLERDVALKKLRADRVSSRSARQAFVAEAIVTGKLEHPNIIPVYALENDDEICLAMKLVGGRNWKELLADEDDVFFHVEILIQVCHALAYAHSRSVAHLDLKPSNVMVGEFGEVLVLDWGLAVEFGRRRSSGSIRHCRSIDGPCGTPAYMAPELAMGRGDRVGPWTDVYLLGAILFEILSGRPPHESKNLLTALSHAMEAQPPELDESVPAELRSLCQQALAFHPGERPADVETFRGRLRDYLRHRESHALVAASCERLERCQDPARAEDRLRLYADFAEAVAGFKQAASLWNGHRPAIDGLQQARLAYTRAALERGDFGLASLQASDIEGQVGLELRGRIASEVVAQRRRRLAARRVRAALAVCLGLLLIGLLGGLWLLDRKNRMIEGQRADALARGEIAQETLETLETQIIDLLLDSVATRRAHEISRELLETARGGWERLQAAHLEAGLTQRRAARISLRLGQILLELDGDLVGARAAFEDALRVLLRLDPTGAEGLPRDIALARRLLADAHVAGGELSEARELLDAALLTRRAEYQRVSGQVEAGRELATDLERLGVLLQLQGELVAADSAYSEALRLDRSRLARLPADAQARRDVSKGLEKVARLHELRGSLVQARAAYGEALQLAAALLHEDPRDARLRADVGYLQLRLGRLLRLQGASQTAEAYLAEALSTRRVLLRLDTASVSARQDLAVALFQMGVLVQEVRDTEEAAALYEEALQLVASITPQDSTYLLPRRELAVVWDGVGDTRQQRGDLDGAEQAWRESLRLRRQLLASQEDSQDAARDLTVPMQRLISLLRERGALDEAEALSSECLELSARLLRQSPSHAARRDYANALERQAELLRARQAWPEALSYYQKVLAERRVLAAVDASNLEAQRDLQVGLSSLGDALFLAGRAGEATAWYVEALELARARQQPGIAGRQARRDLAGCHIRCGDAAYARASWLAGLLHFRRARRIMAGLVEQDPEHVDDQRELSVVWHKLGTCAEQLGDPERATRLYSRAAANHRLLAQTMPRFEPELELLEAAAERTAVEASQATLLSGWRAAESGADFGALAFDAFQQARFDVAASAYARAFEADAPLLPDHWWAASSAAAQAAQQAESEQAARLEAQALVWLGNWLAVVRASLAGAELEAGERARLEAAQRYVRDEDPSFSALRGRPDFEALFGR